MLFVVFTPMNLFSEDYGQEAMEDASSSFTMQVCGTIERTTSEDSERPTFFVQDKKSNIQFLMEGVVPDDKTEGQFYMEGRFLPDNTYCNLKLVKTPDAIPFGEEHCWYTVYDKSKKLLVLYMDSEDMCGNANSICEVSRTSTKMDDMCLMLEEMGRVDHEKLEKAVQGENRSVAGFLTVVADRPLSKKEIQDHYHTHKRKHASISESEKMKVVQSQTLPQ